MYLSLLHDINYQTLYPRVNFPVARIPEKFIMHDIGDERCAPRAHFLSRTWPRKGLYISVYFPRRFSAVYWVMDRWDYLYTYISSHVCIYACIYETFQTLTFVRAVGFREMINNSCYIMGWANFVFSVNWELYIYTQFIYCAGCVCRCVRVLQETIISE